jgi:hypothetical protein
MFDFREKLKKEMKSKVKEYKNIEILTENV